MDGAIAILIALDLAADNAGGGFQLRFLGDEQSSPSSRHRVSGEERRLALLEAFVELAEPIPWDELEREEASAALARDPRTRPAATARAATRSSPRGSSPNATAGADRRDVNLRAALRELVVGDSRRSAYSTLENPSHDLVSALTADADMYLSGGGIYVGAGGATYTGKAISPARALAIAAVFACVRVLAEDVGAMPLHTFEKVTRTGRTAGRARYARAFTRRTTHARSCSARSRTRSSPRRRNGSSRRGTC
jgi:hypothetical protein